MKKIIFPIVCCLLATVQYAYAQQDYGKVFLQHAGKITSIFAGNDMDKAIAAAAEGDTLFLSKGQFSAFTINKSISLIGSGVDSNNTQSSNSTWCEWNSTSVRSENDKTIASVYIEGLNFTYGLNIQGNVDNLVIKKCYSQNSFSLYSNNNNVYKKVTVDRCRFYGLYMNGSIQELTAKNCKINYCSGQGGTTLASCKLINCNIRQVSSNTKAMFVNSVINQVGDGTSAYLGENAILVNTLFHVLNGYDPMENTSQQDCWSTTETVISNNTGDLDCTMTAEQLKSAGYLGVDGTVVGIEGGVNPYSLTIHAPSINSKSANVDLTNKKVTINVNVTATAN